MPQSPQWLTSFETSTQEGPQLLSSPWQVQAACTQRLPAAQLFEQAPQCALFVSRFTHAPAQRVCPELQSEPPEPRFSSGSSAQLSAHTSTSEMATTNPYLRPPLFARFGRRADSWGITPPLPVRKA
jgi:hypothetical protein